MPGDKTRDILFPADFRHQRVAASGDGNKLPTTLAEENEIKDTSVWWSIISRFLDLPCLRATLLPVRVGHKSLMKIKQRKNYIHLAVTIVPVFSTPETFQGRFCLRQPFLSSTASARASSGLSGPPCSFSGLFALSLFLSLCTSSFLPYSFFTPRPSFVNLLYLCENGINRSRVCRCSILQYRVRCNGEV